MTTSNCEQCRCYRRTIRRLARQLLGGDKPRCVACGSTTQLECAHVAPTGLCGRGRGMDRRYRDVLSNPDHYALLCRSCHLDYDCGDLELPPAALAGKRRRLSPVPL